MSESVKGVGEAISSVIETLPGAFAGDSSSHISDARQLLVEAAGVELPPGLDRVEQTLVQASAKLMEAREGLQVSARGLSDYLEAIGFASASGPDRIWPCQIEGRYYSVNDEGDSYMLDPITGEALSPFEIPESLAQQQDLNKGFEFWRRYASQVDFTLLLTRHAEAADLANAGIDLQAEAEGVSRGTLFIEFVGTEKNCPILRTSFNIVAAAQREKALEALSDLNRDAGDDFLYGALRQVAGTQATVELPDYIKDSDHPADKVLAQWKNLKEAVEQGQAGKAKTLDVWQGLHAGFVLYRDWYLVAKMGACLSRRLERGLPVNDAKLLVGTSHRTIGNILERFGARVTYKGKTDAEGTEWVENSTGRGFITSEERIDFVAAGIKGTNS